MQQQLAHEISGALYEKTRIFGHFEQAELIAAPQAVDVHREAIFCLVYNAWRAGENLGVLRVTADKAFIAALSGFPQNDLPFLSLYHNLVEAVFDDLTGHSVSQIPGLEILLPHNPANGLDAA